MDAARPLLSSTRPAGRLTSHLGVAQSLLAMGHIEDAKRALARLAPGNELSRSMVEPEVLLVRAEIRLRTGDRHGARATLVPAIARLRAQLGPDAWSQTLFRLERLAQVAREVGDWSLAEYAATQMLEHDGSYAGTHYALALVSEHQGDRARAIEAFLLAGRYCACDRFECDVLSPGSTHYDLRAIAVSDRTTLRTTLKGLTQFVVHELACVPVTRRRRGRSRSEYG